MGADTASCVNRESERGAPGAENIEKRAACGAQWVIGVGTGIWHLYVLRCADDSLYAGIALDPERRLTEHNTSVRGAKYTRSRRPVALVTSWAIGEQSVTRAAEHAFKRVRRAEKLRMLEYDRGQLLVALGLAD